MATNTTVGQGGLLAVVFFPVHDHLAFEHFGFLYAPAPLRREADNESVLHFVTLKESAVVKVGADFVDPFPHRKFRDGAQQWARANTGSRHR